MNPLFTVPGYIQKGKKELAKLLVNQFLSHIQLKVFRAHLIATQ